MNKNHFESATDLVAGVGVDQQLQEERPRVPGFSGRLEDLQGNYTAVNRRRGGDHCHLLNLSFGFPTG